METNNAILNFIENNWIAIVTLLISITKIVPPEYLGLWKYNNNDPNQGLAPKMSLLVWFLHSLLDSLIRSFILSILAAFGLRNMITLIIFIVVGFDVFSGHQISTASITLIVVGIVALYLDKLVETGKKINLFGILYWEKQGTP